jgi:hypothetical protein
VLSQAHAGDREARRLIEPRLLSDADVLPAIASERVRLDLQNFWKARADGEWTTALALEHVLADLESFCAPESLRTLCQRSIRDERRHTAWCTAMVQRLGAVTYEPRLKGSRPLTFHGAGAAENALFRCIFAGCISETIALHVLRRSHTDITSRPIRTVNRLHMGEEVGHARLGWAFLGWLRESCRLDQATRTTLQNALPALIDISVRSWLDAAREHETECAQVGAIQLTHVEVGIREALGEVIIPGFSSYAIELRNPCAWLAPK